LLPIPAFIELGKASKMYFAGFLGNLINENGLSLALSTITLSLSSQKTSIGKKTNNISTQELRVPSSLLVINNTSSLLNFFENLNPINLLKVELQYLILI